jgi:NAD(P)-dependent dehydrogenase (short-subunit alcohol dehydrogenase family)
VNGLQDRVAIVTGGAAGIGRACAVRFAREGAAVLVADIDARGAEAVSEEIRADGGRAIALRIDVATERDIETMVDAAVSEYGRLDILHNNAAKVGGTSLAEDRSVADTSADIWRSTFEVNLMGAVLGCHYAIPAMIASGGGAIVNMSSIMAARGYRTQTAYAAMKGAIETFTMFVATQYGPQAIRCNAVAPGPTMTERVEATLPALEKEIREYRIMTPYVGTPEDIANAVVFLASDEARYITGQVLTVDGGCNVARSDIPLRAFRDDLERLATR